MYASSRRGTGAAPPVTWPPKDAPTAAVPRWPVLRLRRVPRSQPHRRCYCRAPYSPPRSHSARVACGGAASAPGRAWATPSTVHPGVRKATVPAVGSPATVGATCRWPSAAHSVLVPGTAAVHAMYIRARVPGRLSTAFGVEPAAHTHIWRTRRCATTATKRRLRLRSARGALKNLARKMCRDSWPGRDEWFRRDVIARCPSLRSAAAAASATQKA